MHQRAEDPMNQPEPSPTKVELRPNESRVLSTADLAGTTPEREERDSFVVEQSNVTPIGPRVQQPQPVDRPQTANENEADRHPTLFRAEDTERFRSRWTDVQAGFVDEPRRAVELADTLVAETIKRLAEGFAHERSQLEAQWSRGEDVSTEDLRLALRRYRSFFDRLLSV
jgi:hypothetical protein